MSKIGLIIGREYFTRVKKKSFLVMTILVPLLMVGFYAGILVIAMKGGTDKKTIAVIDEAGIFKDSVAFTKNEDFTFTLINNETEKSFIPNIRMRVIIHFYIFRNLTLTLPKVLYCIVHLPQA